MMAVMAAATTEMIQLYMYIEVKKKKLLLMAVMVVEAAANKNN